MLYSEAKKENKKSRVCYEVYVCLLCNTTNVTIEKDSIPHPWYFIFNYIMYISTAVLVFFLRLFFPPKESHLYAVAITIGVILKFNSKHVQVILQPSFTELKPLFWCTTSHKSPSQRNSHKCRKVKIQVKCYLSFRSTALLLFSFHISLLGGNF